MKIDVSYMKKSIFGKYIDNNIILQGVYYLWYIHVGI